MFPRRCRYRQASGILVVVFLLFVVLQLMVIQNQRTINTINNLENINEGRRLFEQKSGDEQVSVLFNLPPRSKALINYVYKMIKLPSAGEYNLTYPLIDDFSRGQCQKIDEYLNKTENGFFIEIGAFDGEKNSVSLFFERKRHWSGLLVEPHPENYKKLIGKHRHSMSLQACIKTNGTGSSKEYNVFIDHPVYIPCAWMETILWASGHKNIDLLALNVNSLEQDIMESIPFDKFNIRTISIEFTSGSDNERSLIKYLMEKGYRAHHQFTNHIVEKTDLIFVKVDQ